MRYPVVGGYAVAFHGHPRYTKDLDVWVDPDPANVARLLTALADFGFASVGLQAANFEDPEIVVQLGRPPLRIDPCGSPPDRHLRRSLRLGLRRAGGDASGTSVPVIDLAHLLASKLASGRPRDLDDARRLSDRGTAGEGR